MTSTTNNKVSLGSISHGTMRPEDLIETFADVLESLDVDKAYTDLIQECNAMMGRLDEGDLTEKEIDDLGYLINEQLFDALNEFCPPYTYFGAHPGDGADYGFWPAIDALQEDLDQAIDITIEGNEYKLLPDDGLLVEVSDHGNVTLYQIATGPEIWSCV